MMTTTTISISHFENAQSFSPVLHQNRENIINNRSKTRYTNEAIIAGMKSRDNMIINYVYERSYRQIKFLITSNSGNKMDAEDLFQDAMVVIYKKISTDDLQLSSSFETYLYAICKHLWLQRLSKRNLNDENKELSDLAERQDDNNMEEHIKESEKYKLFQLHFLRLSANDQKVLNLYMSKTSLKKIAHIMGYKSDKYAKFRKYIIKEKLKNSIINDPHYQQIYQNEFLTPVS